MVRVPATISNIQYTISCDILSNSSLDIDIDMIRINFYIPQIVEMLHVKRFINIVTVLWVLKGSVAERSKALV